MFGFLKRTYASPVHTRPSRAHSMRGAGVTFRKKKYITHTTLHDKESALQTLAAPQKKFLFFALCLWVLCLLVKPLFTIQVTIALISCIYLLDVLFYLFLSIQSLKTSQEISVTHKTLRSLKDSTLPVYSILCPLYKEAHMLPQFLAGIQNLDWPKEKLDVLLLLEKDDKETIQAVKRMHLPSFVTTIIVPHSLPKTKPKACNYGLSFAKGKYVVIYDAEDIPDRLQLKKAYCAFKKTDKNVICLQAKLNYYNPHQNLLTRLFTTEYSLWFDIALTGLQSLATIIPLGGTSNHFKTKNLQKLKGWDAFNVTEDADLGVRLFKNGYKTAIIDSTTLEEANSNLGNWFRQRSRWIKGYMQTYLVHTRKNTTFVQQKGIHALFFHLTVGGKIAFILINPLLWLITICYFAFRGVAGPVIETVYPGFVLYIALLSLILGNFLFFFYYMLGCAKKEQWNLIKFVYLIPFYWVLMSGAAAVALYQLIFRPHYWEKTLHGLWVKRKQLVSDAVLAKEEKEGYFGFPKKVYAKLILTLKEKEYVSGSLLIFATVVSNFINFLFNVYLGRTVSFEIFSLISITSSFWYLANIFFFSLLGTVNYYTSYLNAKRGKTTSIAFTLATIKRVTIIAGILTILWVVLTPFLTTFFSINQPFVILFFTPVILMGSVSVVCRAYFQGKFYFSLVALLVLIEPFIRLLSAIVLVSLHLSYWSFISIPFSISATCIVSVIYFTLQIKSRPLSSHRFAFPTRFFFASLLASLAGTAFLTFDIVLVKHFMSPAAAGQYAVLTLVGKMIFFFGSLCNIFMYSFIARDVGFGKNPNNAFYKIFVGNFVLTGISFIALGLLGHSTVPFLLGHKAIVIIPYLFIYSLGIMIFVLANTILSFHVARKQYAFPFFAILSAIGMCVGIVLFHKSIKDVVYVILWASTLHGILMILLHSFFGNRKYILTNLADFRDVFFPTKVTESIPLEKRILLFNWRDVSHKFAGGAELYVHEIAKQWVKKGFLVTVFCGNDGNCPREETIEGVHIVRRGGFYTVYLWAFIYYIVQFRGRFGSIVESQNGLPFFTPLYTNESVFALMHHVHQEVFYHSLPLPLAIIAATFESKIMPVVYRNAIFITVSRSTKKDMIQLGIDPKSIHVVHPGVDVEKLKPGKKSKYPLVLYLGRLKPYKSIDVLLRAFAQLLRSVPTAHLTIVGSGESEMQLKRLTLEMSIKSRVTFTGRVSEKKKTHYFQKAWVYVNPSLKEGWGITTIEANACGTPVIASNVPGLREAVKNPHTGYLVPYGDVDGFEKALKEILTNTKKRKKLEEFSLIWAEQFRWEKSANQFMRHMKKNTQKHKDAQSFIVHTIVQIF